MPIAESSKNHIHQGDIGLRSIICHLPFPINIKYIFKGLTLSEYVNELDVF